MPVVRRSIRPRSSLIGVVAVLVASCTAIVAASAAYPKPSPVPFRWELDFEPGPLRLYVDEGRGEMYWFFTYTVVNNTGEDRLWAPAFTLFTDVGEILVSGRDVPSRVTEELASVLGNDLIETQNEAIGDLLQGRAHARDGLVIWPAKRMDVNELSLFVSGISGETARVVHPITGEDLIFRKTLQRNYLIPGNADAWVGRKIGLVNQQWVMR